MKDSEHLRDSALKLGIDLDNTSIKKFLFYLEVLKKWNKKLNLTSLEDNQEIITKHFIDSLTIISYLFDNCRMLDLGSGAGFPGIPISIVKGSVYVTLLESREKRTYFLNHIVRQLELLNVSVVRGRAEDRGNKIERGVFDFVICRAFGKIENIIDSGKEYLNRSGKIILMRGSRGLEELEECRSRLSDEINIEDECPTVLPNSDYKRFNILISLKR